MMVVGHIKNQKIREGHWTSKVDGKGALWLKLDEQPKAFDAENITLRYGTVGVPVTVKFVEWNPTYNIALVVIVSGN